MRRARWKRKNVSFQLSPWDMGKVGGCGPRDGASGRNLPGFIRVRYTSAFGRAFMPQVGTLGANLRVLVGRASASGPADAAGAVILHWRGLRGMQPPVGADLRPKSRPAGGWPPKGGLRAALPTSACRHNLGRWVRICGRPTQGLNHPTRAFRFAMHSVVGYDAEIL